MPESRFKSIVWTLALPWAGATAQALEFGAASPTAVLGAPLLFEVALKQPPGVEIAPRCVAADVAVGGVLVPAKAVSVSMRRSDAVTWVQVRTSVVIDDPVVGVVVSAGCPAQLTRRFTVLADPPEAGRVVEATPPQVGAQGADSPVPVRRIAARPGPPAVAPLGAVAIEAPGSSAAGRRAGAVSEASASTPAVDGASRARLELAPAVASAASAVSGPVPGASSPADLAAHAQARVQSLESSLLALRIESRQQRESLARLEAALTQAQSQFRLAGGIAAALGVALAAMTAWALRRRRGALEDRPPRWSVAEPAPASAMSSEPAFGPGVALERSPPLPSVVGSSTGQEPRPTVVAAGEHRSPVGGEDAMERTRLIAPASAAVSAPLHAVSMEEVLDLEQQVEFLTVLGREDAAVELLTEHLRRTGGTHPSPFLRLMELHRRRGERDAYERLRARFNERFNAVAAAFGAPVAPQRGLEDHQALMLSIERAWFRPLDATTLLENLMFRSAAREPLDVAALEEVVFLHALARDLDQQASRASGTVDVLLPLDESGDEEGPAIPASPAPVAVARPAAAAAAAEAQVAGAAVLATDPWPTISTADFDVGGLEMEPLAPPPESTRAPAKPA